MNAPFAAKMPYHLPGSTLYCLTVQFSAMWPEPVHLVQTSLSTETEEHTLPFYV